MTRSVLFVLSLLAPGAALPAQLPPSHLLVTSRHGDEVLLYDGSGAFLRSFASGGGLDNPIGLTFGPDGHLYVVSAETDQILRYDGATGAFLGVFAQGGGLTAPRNLEFGPDGHLYVCSGRTHQVLRYDGRSGAPLGVFAQDPALSAPTSATFGPDFDLYVGSVLNNWVVRFDGRSGRSKGVFARGNMSGTHDLSFGPDGHLYVSNAFGTEDVVRFDGQTGASLGTFVRDGSSTTPLGITWGLDGDLYLCSQGTHEVRRYDGTTGRLVGVHVRARSGGLDGPLFCAFAPHTGGLTWQPPAPAGVGVDAVFAMTGGRAGGIAVIAVGLTPGRLPLPCPSLALGMIDPLVLGHGAADASGNLVLRRHVPSSIAGASLLFQAIDLTGCATSPLVAHRF